jgi:hypothetical protein
MASTLFLDEGGYYIWCFAAEDENSKYEASATFERKIDFAEGKTLIPGVRHLIKQSKRPAIPPRCLRSCSSRQGTAGRQRCGSNSPMRLAGCVGSCSITSFM